MCSDADKYWCTCVYLFALRALAVQQYGNTNKGQNKGCKLLTEERGGINGYSPTHTLHCPVN